MNHGLRPSRPVHLRGVCSLHLQRWASPLASPAVSLAPPRSAALPTWRSGLLLALGVLVTRLPALLHPRAIDDEQVYAVIARVMLHGGKPYLDAVERKPPLLFGLYAAILGIGGSDNWFLLHAVASAWTLATMGLLWLIGRRLFDGRTGCWAALLYGLFAAWADYRGLALNGELLMNLPIVAAVALVFGPERRRWRPELLAAGCCLALAFLLKQPAGIAGLPLGLYLLRRDYRDARGLGWGDSLWHAAELTAGFLATLALTALLLAHAGILQQAIYWTIQDHRDPIGPSTWHFWREALRGTLLFLVSAAPLVGAAALALGRGASGRKDVWRRRRPEFAALVILLLVSLLGVSASGQFLYHYYLQLLPPLALLAAPVLAGAWVVASPIRRGLLVGWLALSAVVFLVVDGLGVLQHRTPTEAGQWLRSHSQPQDRIFVWGQSDRDTGIYLDADRLPASRYLASYPLTGHIFGGYPAAWGPRYEDERVRPGNWDDLWQDFRRHPPVYIVDTEAARDDGHYPMSRYPALDDYIAREYLPVHAAADGVIFRRR